MLAKYHVIGIAILFAISTSTINSIESILARLKTDAPITLRTPISFVLEEARNDTSPSRPMTAIAIVIAAKAVSFKEILDNDFKAYAQQIVDNAQRLAEGLTKEGVRLVSGGTDNHLLLLDVSKLGLTGKDAEHALDEVGVTTNKNTIPFDKEGPFITSGVRIGTAAVTTRGFKLEEMDELAAIIATTLKHHDDTAKLEEVKGRVKALADRFPLYK